MSDEIRMAYFLGFVCFGGLSWIGLLMAPTWWSLVVGGFRGYSAEAAEQWLDRGLRVFGFSTGVVGFVVWAGVLRLAWSLFWLSLD